MVCNWGMSEKLGPITFGKTEEHIFLGREIAQHADYSEATAVLIDQEVRQFVERAEMTAKRIVTENVDKLHKLARALLEREIIDGREVDVIIGRISGDPQPAAAPVPIG
jgi:cell division protease FtsH